MSTYCRLRSRRQLRHPASRSKSHDLDKRQAEARRATKWVPINSPIHPNRQRDFGPIKGHEYKFDGTQWVRCTEPEEYADYLEATARKLDWYIKKTRRKGIEIDMKRPATPLENLIISCAPWLSDWTAAEVAAGRDPRSQLASIRNLWLDAAQTALTGKRHIVGYACHADTDDLHFDLGVTRQDGSGGRIGPTGLRLVGPWCVGVDRQLRVGAQISPVKHNQFRRAVANFRRRYSDDAVPLDIALARALDASAEQVIGDDLTPYREKYARSVPELERQHLAAELSALRAAEAKLRQQGNELQPGLDSPALD